MVAHWTTRYKTNRAIPKIRIRMAKNLQRGFRARKRRLSGRKRKMPVNGYKGGFAYNSRQRLKLNSLTSVATIFKKKNDVPNVDSSGSTGFLKLNNKDGHETTTDSHGIVNLWNLGHTPSQAMKSVNCYNQDCNTSVNFNGAKLEFVVKSLSVHSPPSIRIIVVRDKYEILPGLPDDIVMAKDPGSLTAITNQMDFFKTINSPLEPRDWSSASLKANRLILPINDMRYQVLYDKVVKLNATQGDPTTGVNATTSASSTNVVRNLDVWLPIKKELIYRYDTTTPKNESVKCFAYAALTSDDIPANSTSNPTTVLAAIRCLSFEYVRSGNVHDFD